MAMHEKLSGRKRWAFGGTLVAALFLGAHGASGRPGPAAPTEGATAPTPPGNPTPSNPTPGEVWLLAFDGEHHAPGAALRPGGPPAVFALATRSTMAPRSVAVRGLHGFRVVVDASNPEDRMGLRARFLEHPADHALVWAEDPTSDLGPAAYLVGPPQLPQSARGRPVAPTGLWARAPGESEAKERSALPELARWDGLLWAGDLVVEPGPLAPGHLWLTAGGDRRVSPDQGSEPFGVELWERPGSGDVSERLLLQATIEPGGHLVLPAPKGPFTLRAKGPLDALRFADARPVDPSEGIELEALAVRVTRRAERDGTHRVGGLGPTLQIPAAARERGRERWAELGDRAPQPGEIVELSFRSPGVPKAGQSASLLLSLDPRAATLSSPALRLADEGAPRFVERAAELGIQQVHFEGPDLQLDIRPTMGPGLALGDVDGDGWVDLYLVQGGGRGGSEVDGNRLFLNRSRDGQIDLVDGSAAGARDRGMGMGALFFDGDGDGRLDLYVANYGPDSLWHNRADPHSPLGFLLVDQSAAAGLVLDLWSAGVTAGDPDRDGDLDLYVAGYLRYDESELPEPGDGRFAREDPPAMLPYAFPGERNIYLRNESGAEGLRFVDATEELGLLDVQGRGMQPIFWDFDRDGSVDLYVANDVSINQLFHNLGDGTFREVSFAAGMDDPRGGMGVATGDVDGDGDEDLVLTNWQLESNALYINHLDGTQSQRTRVPAFRDLAVEAGIGRPSVGLTGWGALLEDFDGDGDLDLAVANGYTSPDYESTGICVGQPAHLFENDGEARFAPVHSEWAPAFSKRAAWRALAACDLAQRGALDLIMTANNGPTALLQNTQATGRWLGVRLRGQGKNTHGIGAEVAVFLGERVMRRTLVAGTSYLVGNAPELWFGLGDGELTRVEVRWPSGRVSQHLELAPGRFHVLREPIADGAR